MTKHFKKFDRIFSKQVISECRDHYLYSRARKPNFLVKYQEHGCWFRKVESWSQEFVQYSVYRADGYLHWQLFRVSMKGLSTAEKLFMLHQYLTETIQSVRALDTIPDQIDVDRCRVDNYIGALRRGGQLDENYKIVR